MHTGIIRQSKKHWKTHKNLKIKKEKKTKINLEINKYTKTDILVKFHNASVSRQYQNHFAEHKIILRVLRTLLLRICSRFYENPIRNEKVRRKKYSTQKTCFDLKANM